MQIVLHVGAHCTDDDRLLRCLRKNVGTLAEQGIAAPEVSRYRPKIRETLSAQQGDDIMAEPQASILDGLLEDDDIGRVVLSHDNFMGVPGRSVENNMLYPVIGQRTPRLRALFDGHDVEIFMAMRDPASFIPAVYDRTNAPDFATFLEGSDPMELRWSNVIQRQRAAAPDVPITTWCNEDTPLIWHEILREMSGHDRYTVLDGRDDFLGELMVKGGLQRMQAYLEAHPPQNEMQRRRVVVAFLDKFAKPDALEEEIDLPGWTQDYMAQLSAIYDDDMDVVRQIPGVTLLTP